MDITGCLTDERLDRIPTRNSSWSRIIRQRSTLLKRIAKRKDIPIIAWMGALLFVCAVLISYHVMSGRPRLKSAKNMSTSSIERHRSSAVSSIHELKRFTTKCDGSPLLAKLESRRRRPQPDRSVQAVSDRLRLEPKVCFPACRA